jgi:hypothetical protein
MEHQQSNYGTVGKLIKSTEQRFKISLADAAFIHAFLSKFSGKIYPVP